MTTITPPVYLCGQNRCRIPVPKLGLRCQFHQSEQRKRKRKPIPPRGSPGNPHIVGGHRLNRSHTFPPTPAGRTYAPESYCVGCSASSHSIAATMPCGGRT